MGFLGSKKNVLSTFDHARYLTMLYATSRYFQMPLWSTKSSGTNVENLLRKNHKGLKNTLSIKTYLNNVRKCL